MRKRKLDRWDRKADLRALYPELTEDEALALRAAVEDDASYVKHLSAEELEAVLQRLAKKGLWEPDHG